jgi:hypothetical protein
MFRLISFDIGKLNLAFAEFLVETTKIASLNFDLKNVSIHGDGPIARCKEIINTLDSLNIKETDHIVIERQTPNNIVAMELMYALITSSLRFTSHITIFDPKLKFTTFHTSYTTKNSAHKKLSINTVREYLREGNETMLEKFETFPKKDDVSDAIFQGLTHLYIEKYIDKIK